MSLSAALLGALVLDVLLAEPPTRVHPVAWFGRAVRTLDRQWRRPRLAGATGAATLPIGAALGATAAVWGATLAAPGGGLVAGALVVFLATSLRALLATVARVSRLATADLSDARAALPALAGRDPSTLDAAAVRSAALESLAENLADGLVAPLTGFAVGAAVAGLGGLGPGLTLAVACGAAVWLKAVNTMDSMLGYPDRPVGTAAALIDDVAMWLPARLSALLVAAWFADPGSLARARTWTPGVGSPNAGWPMGTLAAALDVRLAKPGYYVLNPDGDPPSHAHVRRALARVGLAGLSAYALAGLVAHAAPGLSASVTPGVFAWS